MPARHDEQLPFWSIILTGEEKRQARPPIEQWLGYNKPTPFCTFVGSRSMLQHTWDRADQLSHPNRKITVVEKSYLHEACTQLGGRAPGLIITEPSHRGTVVSLYLSLTYLQAREPGSLVVVYPSGHFVYPEDLFLKSVQQTIWATEQFSDHIFMIGATDSRNHATGGCIASDQPLGWVYGVPVYRVREVFRAFPAQAESAHGSDHPRYLSNTSILAAKAEVLGALGWQFIPEMMELFDELEDAIGTSYERAVLEDIFHNPKLPDVSLIALLQFAPNLAVLELEKVLWSDWREPGQIIKNLAEIGKQPAFPVEYAKNVSG